MMTYSTIDRFSPKKELWKEEITFHDHENTTEEYKLDLPFENYHELAIDVFRNMEATGPNLVAGIINVTLGTSYSIIFDIPDPTESIGEELLAASRENIELLDCLVNSFYAIKSKYPNSIITADIEQDIEDIDTERIVIRVKYKIEDPKHWISLQKSIKNIVRQHETENIFFYTIVERL